MIKTITFVAAMLAAGTALAGDLPSKKTAPLPPVVERPAAEPADSITVTGGYEQSSASVDSYKGNFNWVHTLGAGFSVGAQAETAQTPDTHVQKSLVEANAYYKLPIMAGVSLKAGVGVGERFQTTNFAYYALYGGADYAATDKLTWNAVSYRYRNAFDTANAFESHQVGTGVTYALTATTAVNAKVYRSFDNGWNKTADGVNIGYTVKF